MKQVVFISGGTSGINLGIAKKFAEIGANVLVFGRDPEKAKRAAAEIRENATGEIMEGAVDVRDYDGLAALFQDATAKLGAPTVVIAGAAGNFMAPAAKISANGFKTVVDIDLLGSYNTFRAAFDVVPEEGASMIAITAPQATMAIPGQVHVCAAKAGINQMVKVLAMEWGSAGIRVNAISPGPILGTEGVERMAPTDEDKKMWTDRTALRRFGLPEDIANTAVFLSSKEGSYITGTILDCDGGMKLGDAAGNFLQ